MTNYYDNTLTVTGNDKEIERLVRAVWSEDSEFDFNKIIPEPSWEGQKEESPFSSLEEAIQVLGPAAEKNLDLIFDSPRWYAWRLINWGTKWEACDPEMTIRSDEIVQYVFRTAWSLPLPILKKLARDFPALKFELRYYSPDFNDSGIIRYNYKKKKPRLTLHAAP